MMVLGLDPGTTHTGVARVKWHKGTRPNLIGTDHVRNGSIEPLIRAHKGLVAIERITIQGKTPMGKTTVDTMLWSGRFWQVATEVAIEPIWVTRREALGAAGAQTKDDAGCRKGLRERFCSEGCEPRQRCKGCGLQGTTHHHAAIAVALAAGKRLGLLTDGHTE